ncbi:hypothetical protein NLM16_05275 [Bradyrhizobium brasilense]|uniref:hypothetical protein n=1 Tax=Bradyrhizobium brasilense TaxID=1419277 RepID=UPI002877BBC3|nr:hypothetical protein [Bradyrhizobium brasilense]MCP3413509.1 hypothetical protein [Bradyrhizobium brasilense]
MIKAVSRGCAGAFRPSGCAAVMTWSIIKRLTRQSWRPSSSTGAVASQFEDGNERVEPWSARSAELELEAKRAPDFLQCFGAPIRYTALDLGDLTRRKCEELRGLGLR